MTEAPVRLRTAAAVTRISAPVMATASLGLRLPMMPMTTATTTRVIPIPAVRAFLSFSPKVRMANSLSHSGVNWMKVWPSEKIGADGVFSRPNHWPRAASSSASPIAMPMAMTPTSAAAAIPGRQGCRSSGAPVPDAGPGRSVLGGVDRVMPGIRAPAASGWAERGKTFTGCCGVGSVTLSSSASHGRIYRCVTVS